MHGGDGVDQLVDVIDLADEPARSGAHRLGGHLHVVVGGHDHGGGDHLVVQGVGYELEPALVVELRIDDQDIDVEPGEGAARVGDVGLATDEIYGWLDFETPRQGIQKQLVIVDEEDSDRFRSALVLVLDVRNSSSARTPPSSSEIIAPSDDLGIWSMRDLVVLHLS